MNQEAMIRLEDLRQNEKNARKITPEHFELLRKSVQKRPWMFKARPIVVRKEDGVVLGGNMRVAALKANGETEIPADWVRFVEWDQKQAEDFHVIDNENYGEWIAEELIALYGADRLAEMDVDVTGLIGEMLKESPTEGKTDPDEVPETPSDPVSRRGEVYRLGDHRLMCGDSTSEADMAALMQGDKAAFVFTDPPYGVAIGDKNKAIKEVNGGGGITSNIIGDTLSAQELYKVLVAAFTNVRRNCADHASYYVSSPQGGELGLMMMMKDSGLAVRHILIWVKSSACFSLGRLDYDYRHEPIFYTWTKSHDFHGDYSNTVIDDSKPLEKMSKAELKDMVRALQQKAETSVIYCDKPAKSKLHPTMKPVALVARFMSNSSHPGEVVLDAFGGSGTTAIAAQQLGRKARLMELDRHYCDVIRRRWAEFVHGEGCDWQALTPATNETTKEEPAT